MNTQTQEALEKIERRLRADNLDEWSLTALADIAKEALEAEQVCQAQEPVAWNEEEFNAIAYAYRICSVHEIERVSQRYQELVDYVLSITHSTPNSTPDSTPAHQWQGLTDYEIGQIIVNSKYLLAIDFYRAIEQALKEKNHG